MLDTNTIEGTEIVTATYSGTVTTEEMDRLRATTEKVIEQRGAARMLLEFDGTDADGILPKGYVEDPAMTEMLADVSRIALVTDSTWIRGNAELFTAVIDGPVRNFTLDERDEAIEWLRE